jgi:threonine dehydrogenase-like Zn-dependent dehydrogenase
MKALRLEGIDWLTLIDAEPPRPAAGQVLIRTGAATICTSDLHDLRGNPFDIELPVILGHEGAGTVMAIGADVRTIAVGDRVAAHPVHPCLECPTCTGGMPHLCDNMGHFGLNMQGTFAGSFVARADRVRRIPDGMDFAVAALAEPVCVCLEALHQTGLESGQRLLIVGDGPFGVIMARLAATRFGLHTVIAGHHPTRLAFAAPARTVDLRAASDARDALLAANDDIEYDAAILAVASRDAFTLAMAALRPKGRLVVFAPIPGETPVDLFRLLLKELEIVGSVNDQDLIDEAILALADPALAFHELITHRFGIGDFEQAFEIAETDRSAMKVAFTFPSSSATPSTGSVAP